MMEMAADGCDDGNERLSHHNEGGMMRDGWFSQDNGSSWVWWWRAGLMMMAMTHGNGSESILQQYRSTSTITPTTMDDGATSIMAGYHYHPLLRSTSRTLHSWLYPPTNRPCPRTRSQTVGGKVFPIPQSTWIYLPAISTYCTVRLPLWRWTDKTRQRKWRSEVEDGWGVVSSK